MVTSSPHFLAYLLSGLVLGFVGCASPAYEQQTNHQQAAAAAQQWEEQQRSRQAEVFESRLNQIIFNCQKQHDTASDRVACSEAGTLPLYETIGYPYMDLVMTYWANARMIAARRDAGELTREMADAMDAAVRAEWAQVERARQQAERQGATVTALQALQMLRSTDPSFCQSYPFLAGQVSQCW